MKVCSPVVNEKLKTVETKWNALEMFDDHTRDPALCTER